MIPPLVEKKLEELVVEHAAVETCLAEPGVHERSDYADLTRKLGTLAKRVSKFREYQDLCKQLGENEELSRSASEDAELRELAKAEVNELEPRVAQLTTELIDMMLVEDKNASKNVIMEIRAGAGGDEAALFAADLFRMYSKYVERKGWKIEVLDQSPTDLKGFKEITFSVTGESVFRDLNYEMGGHRVQRVPDTETSGRIHTSMATVAVMSEPEEVEVEVKQSDLRIDFYRSSGPGGQNVNKTSSAVRITHQPTGLVVAIQEESSQHKNKAKAMRVLRSRLYDLYESERKSKEQDTRRSQIGSGDRNQRVRTYNFPQNRVTDHRIGLTLHRLEAITSGDLDELIDALFTHFQAERLKKELVA